MNPTTILILRKLLQTAAEIDTTLDGGTNNNPETSSSISAVRRRPFNPATPTKTFDSTMALTIVLLLTALFFLAFFSLYIRRYSATADPSSPPPPPTNRKGGLDISTVNSLPLVAYDKAAAKHQIIVVDDCPICLTQFQERETVKLIPYCGHVFHPDCVNTWLESHVTCPLCRSAQMFKRDDEVCLDVDVDVVHDKKNESSSGGIEIGERSTVRDCDTCSVGVRRVGSCTNLAHQAVLQRSTSV